MRKIYTLRRTRDRFTASRVLVGIGAVAVVVSLAVQHGLEWPRAAVASAPAPTRVSVTPDATVYFPSQYELHAGPPEPLPATF